MRERDIERDTKRIEREGRERERREREREKERERERKKRRWRKNGPELESSFFEMESDSKLYCIQSLVTSPTQRK